MGIRLLATEFELGQVVYLRTDEEHLPRIITGVKLHLGGGLSYELSQGANASMHYEPEISAEPSVLSVSLL